MGPRVAGVLGLWLAAALLAGASGGYAGVSALGLAATVGGLLAAAGLAWVWSPRLRRWALGLDLRWLAWFHVWRVLVGFGLLSLYDQGRLPWRLAGPSGLIEVTLALTAPGVARLAGAGTVGRLAPVFAWHALGAVNGVSLATTAVRLAVRNDPLVGVVTAFPLSLYPTFLGPLALMTHAVALAAIWIRPLAGRPPSRPPEPAGAASLPKRPVN